MDEQLTEILQQQLRDVHLPQAVGWWPLSLAWWFTILALLLSLCVLGVYLIRQHKRNRYRTLALEQLRRHFSTWQHTKDSSVYLQHANDILKRCMIHFDPGVSKLSGSAWVMALAQYSSASLSEQSQSAIAHSVYQANPKVNTQQLHQELCHWIKKHKALKQHASEQANV